MLLQLRWLTSFGFAESAGYVKSRQGMRYKTVFVCKYQ